MSARRPKLPPLPSHQMIWRHFDGRTRWKGGPSYRDYADTIHCRRMHGDGNFICIIRRLSDGKIVWRNKAAKEAGL